MVNKIRQFLRNMSKVFQMKTILLQDLVHYQIIMNLMVGMIMNFVKVKSMSLMERQCQHKILRYTQNGQLRRSA